MNIALERDTEMSDIEIGKHPDDRLYLIAIKGAAVVPNSVPFTINQMKSMFVRVGRRDEATMWSPSFGRENAEESNYDYLIGYKSLKSQEAGFQKLLNGSIKDARAELERCVYEEVVIDHWTERRFASDEESRGAE